MRLLHLVFHLFAAPMALVQPVLARQPAVTQSRSTRQNRVTTEPTLPPYPSPRPNAKGAQSGEEYLLQASQAMAKQDWETAATAYLGFTRDFTRPETESVVTKFQPSLAVSLLKLGRYAEALPALQHSLNAKPPPPARLQDELIFQSGVCALQLKDYPQARTFFNRLLPRGNTGSRAEQAHLLVAQCHLLEENPETAAAHLAQNRDLLTMSSRSQSLVLEMRALLAAQKPEQAFSLAVQESHTLESSLDAVAFQTTLLRLGSALSAQNLPEQAIQCLRKIRPARQLLELGEAQLDWIKKQETAARETQTEGGNCGPEESRARIVGELNQLREFRSFDTVVSMELSRAYHAIQRTRECALLLSHALETLSDDPLWEQTGAFLAQSWFDLQCWHQVENTARLVREKYPRSPQVPLLNFLAGIAQQKQQRFADAIKTFDSIALSSGGTETGINSRFMIPFTELLSGEPLGAAAHFIEFVKRHPRHHLAEEARAWLTVSRALANQHEDCRSAAANYQRLHPDGPNLPTVLFQSARSASALKDYPTAITELLNLIRHFPDHPKAGEAHLILADAYLAHNEPEQALSTLEAVLPSDPTAFDEAWFKTAKILAQMDRTSEFTRHLQRFAKERSESPRYSLAVLETARSICREGRDIEAESLMWEAINACLSDPKKTASEELLESLWKMPFVQQTQSDRHEKTSAWCARFLTQDQRSNQTVDGVRARWALSKILRESLPNESQRILLGLATTIRADQTSDRILADIAEACTAAGKQDEAKQIWKNLLKWHPMSSHKDRILASWLDEAMSVGSFPEALKLIQRLRLECADSPLAARALLSKSTIEEAAGDLAVARQTLDGLLAERSATGECKAEALLRLGESEMRRASPATAIGYFQRIYVLYARWKPQATRAYLRSAEAFEELGNRAAAARTYRELLQTEMPLETPEKAKVLGNLARLEAPL